MAAGVFFCAVLVILFSSTNIYHLQHPPQELAEEQPEDIQPDFHEDYLKASALTAEWMAENPVDSTSESFVEECYQNSDLHGATLAFWTEETGSEEIAGIILDAAIEYGIAPCRAFALSWTESLYRPRAVNENSASIDRGLFQLNSRSFPEYTEEDFFNPEVSARTGLSYLARWTRYGGNETVALAMYNAGPNRVRNEGTPESTLHYIARIMDKTAALEEEFALYMDSVLEESRPQRNTETAKQVKRFLTVPGA